MEGKVKKGSEETILAADTGTVWVRKKPGKRMTIGINRANDPNGRPEVEIELTARQRATLYDIVAAMVFEESVYDAR